MQKQVNVAGPRLASSERPAAHLTSGTLGFGSCHSSLSDKGRPSGAWGTEDAHAAGRSEHLGLLGAGASHTSLLFTAGGRGRSAWPLTGGYVPTDACTRLLPCQGPFPRDFTTSRQGDPSVTTWREPSEASRIRDSPKDAQHGRGTRVSECWPCLSQGYRGNAGHTLW